MGKLRVKVTQYRKSKENKEQRRISTSRSSELPPIPYIRCGFLQGKAPKVRPESTTATATITPASPVNPKAADIRFPSCPSSPGLQPLVLPCNNAAVCPATSRPKRWLTFGCDPCKQHRSLLREEYKLQPRTPPLAPPRRRHGGGGIIESIDIRDGIHPQVAAPGAPSVRVKMRSSPALQQQQWESEMSWRVLAKSSGNKVVRKQVVLRKRSVSSVSTISPPPSSSGGGDGGGVVPLHLDELESVAAAAGSSSGYVSARTSTDSRSGPARAEVGVYKLTTASPEQSLENNSYAWERDLSPFASEGSSMFTSFDSPTCSAFRPPENRRPSRSSSSSSIKSPAAVAAAQKQSRLKASSSSWISPSRLLDEIIDAQKVRDDPESACRSWDDGLPQFEKETCTWKKRPSSEPDVRKQVVSLEKPQENQGRPEDAEDEDHQKTHVFRKRKHRHHHRRRVSKVTDSVAVEKFSLNPYRDFRESMIDMILKKELFQHRDLEELLKSYLELNRVELHDLIVRVFTDLWYHLFPIESS